MVGSHDAGGRQPNDLPLGATNELLGIPTPDNHRVPRTPEEWHLYAVDSMAELANMGAATVDRDPEHRDWTTRSFGALGTARVDYTEELPAHAEEGLDDPECIVKVHPAPSFVMPPANASLEVLDQARRAYMADAADPVELVWQSRLAHEIVVKRGSADTPLSTLPEEELRKYAERLRGAATAVALELEDYVTLARLRNVWEPDPDLPQHKYRRRRQR